MQKTTTEYELIEEESLYAFNEKVKQMAKDRWEPKYPPLIVSLQDSVIYTQQFEKANRISRRAFRDTKK